MLNDLYYFNDVVWVFYFVYLKINLEFYKYSQYDDLMSGMIGIIIFVCGWKVYVVNVGDLCVVLGVWKFKKVVVKDLLFDQIFYWIDECECVKVYGVWVMMLDQMEGLKDVIVFCWNDENYDDGDLFWFWVVDDMYLGIVFIRSIGDLVVEKIGVIVVLEVLCLEFWFCYFFFFIVSDGVFEFFLSQVVVDIVCILIFCIF